MKFASLLLIGASLASVGGVAQADGKPGGGWAGPRPGAHMGGPGRVWNGGHRWGPRTNGRWYAGWGAPGGWGAYRRPVYGYVLPRYWVSPSYYIGNYGAYGLPAPAYGYGWSRYYDDAVMTDRYGRVYDHRSDIDWDRYEGGYGPDGGYDEPRRDSGAGGAAIGAVVGGVVGNRVAGRGNRTVGTIVGAGVGAVAGAAIDKAEDGPRRGPPPPRPGATYDGPPGGPDGLAPGENAYEGRWSGTWTTDDGRQVSGTYDGRFEGDVRGAGIDYPAPYGQPHWSHGPGMPAGGYVSGGYYYPAPIVTTVTVQPAVTTTTTTTYVTEKVRHVRRPVRGCRCK